MTQAIFQLPPLSHEDQTLIDAYVRTGLSVDELAYTDGFDQLCRNLGKDDSNSSKHEIYRRLLNLRKQGRLPRSYT